MNATFFEALSPGTKFKDRSGCSYVKLIEFKYNRQPRNAQVLAHADADEVGELSYFLPETYVEVE